MVRDPTRPYPSWEKIHKNGPRSFRITELCKALPHGSPEAFISFCEDAHTLNNLTELCDEATHELDEGGSEKGLQ